MIRHLLFQIHMWIGLILGVFFAVLGLSGSVLVYNDEIDRLGTPRATAMGRPAPLDTIVAAARRTAAAPSDNIFLKLPKTSEDPVLVRFLPAPQTLFVDPVTARVLGSRPSPLSALLQAADELHGNLFVGEIGRQIVGWLGVGMTILGLTGLFLWWPRARQWKYAFLVRRSARGLRLNRELHGAAGIWGLTVFVVVSITGVSMVFADTLRSVVAAPTASPMKGPVLAVTSGAPLSIQRSVDLAQQALPSERVRSVVVRAGAATSVAMSGNGAPMLTLAYVDPYRAEVIAIRDPYRLTGVEEYLAWQKPLHIAEGLGPIWRVLVFTSGFLPLIFFVTGAMMWLQKRRNRIAMNRPLPQG
jgi:uncharacterized iron-regulated membrane protein